MKDAPLSDRERARMEATAAMLREGARMQSETGGGAQVPSPGKYQSDAVVGRTMPQDMLRNMEALETGQRARRAPRREGF